MNTKHHNKGEKCLTTVSCRLSEADRHVQHLRSNSSFTRRVLIGTSRI